MKRILVVAYVVAAVAFAVIYRAEPARQPTVLVDVPDPSAAPVHDLELGGSVGR